MKSLMATVVALAALFLSGCGQPVRLDATSLGSQPDEIAVLKCDPDSYCRVSVKRLQDGQYLTVEHYGSSHRRDVWLDEIRLDPGLYQISAQVCYSGLPPSIAGEPVYKLLIFEALPGHDYDIVIQKPNYGYCDGGVSIGDRTMGHIVARWCHPKRIREYPEECEPVDLVSRKQRQEELSKRGEELKRRAGKGDAEAQYRYGLMIQNVRLQWKWYCLAAQSRHPRAQHEIGEFYENGRDPVIKDLLLAYVWHSLAEIHGFEDVPSQYRKTADGWRCCFPDKTRREIVSEKLTAEQIREAERLVAEWEPNPTECKIYSDETHAP